MFIFFDYGHKLCFCIFNSIIHSKLGLKTRPNASHSNHYQFRWARVLPLNGGDAKKPITAVGGPNKLEINKQKIFIQYIL